MIDFIAKIKNVKFWKNEFLTFYWIISRTVIDTVMYCTISESLIPRVSADLNTFWCIEWFGCNKAKCVSQTSKIKNSILAF